MREGRAARWGGQEGMVSAGGCVWDTPALPRDRTGPRDRDSGRGAEEFLMFSGNSTGLPEIKYDCSKHQVAEHAFLRRKAQDWPGDLEHEGKREKEMSVFLGANYSGQKKKIATTQWKELGLRGSRVS